MNDTEKMIVELKEWVSTISFPLQEQEMVFHEIISRHKSNPIDPDKGQRQDSLQEQLADVRKSARRMGCYDAEDWIVSMSGRTFNAPLAPKPEAKTEGGGGGVRDQIRGVLHTGSKEAEDRILLALESERVGEVVLSTGKIIQDTDMGYVYMPDGKKHCYILGKDIFCTGKGKVIFRPEVER